MTRLKKMLSSSLKRKKFLESKSTIKLSSTQTYSAISNPLLKISDMACEATSRARPRKCKRRRNSKLKRRNLRNGQQVRASKENEAKHQNLERAFNKSPKTVLLARRKRRQNLHNNPMLRTNKMTSYAKSQSPLKARSERVRAIALVT